jgi:hypothetical protein
MSLLRFIPLLLILSLKLNAQDIYKTPSGAKYHLAGCRTVKNVSEKITLEQARKLGLEPCKVCHPTSIAMPLAAQPNKAKGEGETVQCRGMTKSGTRCRHKTKIANGYCFQHQPG